MSRFGEYTGGPDLYTRKELHHRCVVDVRGTVVSVDSYEKGQMDGDVKIKLRLHESNYFPKGYYGKTELLNKHNNGLLTVEIVCAVKPRKRLPGWKLPNEMSPVTDPNNDGAVIACRGYKNLVTIPLRNDEILVTGELVTDTGPMRNPEWNENNQSVPRYKLGHGGKEIHPVTKIEILPKGPGNSHPPVRE